MANEAKKFCCHVTHLYPRCRLSIEVWEKTSKESGRTFYHLDYIWTYHKSLVDNPLFQDKEFIENNMEGEIIVKNPMTQNMVELLVMSDKDLAKHSGNKEPKEYRLRIIKAISLFWD